MKELYNIYNLLSFSIENSIGGITGVNFNPEYKYFKSAKKTNNHFNIYYANKMLSQSVLLKHNRKQWNVCFDFITDKKKLFIGKKYLSVIERFTFYLRLKNLYVRSLISTQILAANASLVHSAAFRVKDSSTILAGRPGVFKTSILMDVIRDYKGQFIGEENSLVHNGLVYPFPLNIDSICYKIKRYKDENPSGKLQKILLGLSLILNRKNYNYTLGLPKPSRVKNICYLVKGEKFNIEKVPLLEIMPDLVDNEILELSIPPTHSLSGINYNYFSESLLKLDPEFINNLRSKIEGVFLENFKGCSAFRITSPKEYTKQIAEQIINTVS